MVTAHLDRLASGAELDRDKRCWKLKPVHQPLLALLEVFSPIKWQIWMKQKWSLLLETDAVSRLRASRSGKASHLTRRMNIVNNLLTDKEYLEEVKGNMLKFNELLEDFKDLHAPLCADVG